MRVGCQGDCCHGDIVVSRGTAGFGGDILHRDITEDWPAVRAAPHARLPPHLTAHGLSQVWTSGHHPLGGYVVVVVCVCVCVCV